jgi:tRNA(Arg) A34 adenosine deaminase TadA
MPAILTDDPTEQDIRLLYETVRIARKAKEAGNHPFGALLADKDGNVLLEMGNDSKEGGPAMHAETALLLEAGKRFDPGFLASCSLYTSVEPCVMCCGALYWTNVRRLVFGITERKLLELTGSDARNPTFDLPCDQVLSHGQKSFEIVGPATDPALISAIVSDHVGFWGD